MRTLTVLAQNTSDGFFYPGYIHTNKPDEATVTVQFYSLKPQEVEREQVIVMGGASPCPNLTKGDFVLVQVQYKTTWCVLYVPGIVVLPPNERDIYTKNFLVVTYTRVLVERPRRFLVKIGKEKHDSILKSIQELNPRKNPLLRPGTYPSGSIWRQRRVVQRTTASIYPTQIPSKEVWLGDKTWKSSFLKRAKARKLLTANLRSSKTRLSVNNQKQEKFQDAIGNKQELEEHDKSVRSTSDGTSNKRLRILKEVIGTNKKSNRDKVGDGKENDSDMNKNNAEKNNSVIIDKEKEDHGNIEDGHRDINETTDLRSESPTYSDTFDCSFKSKDSSSPNVIRSEKEEQKGKSIEENHFANKGAREAWTDRNSSRISKSTDYSHCSSKSSKSRSQTTSKSSSISSRPRNTTGKQRVSRRHSSGSDDFSDDTTSTDKTITFDAIAQGQEVLACWSDDGWYYFGVVVTEIGDDKYVVRDATGYKETIDKTNILMDNDQGRQVLQPGDAVIALHPDYVFSYAPGHIRDVYPSSSVTIEFYDMASSKLPVTEVYKISQEKNQKDVNFIKTCEQRLCDSQNTVIARDDNTGLYIQCMAECPTNHNQKFFIRLPDMTFVKQSAIHIFPMRSRDQRQEQMLEYALAPIETGSSIYLPASVIQWRPFCVRFCDGTISRDLLPVQCFYISKDYYNNAVNYFHQVQINRQMTGVVYARQYENRMVPWEESNSDIRSDRFSQQTHSTGRQRQSSSASYDGSAGFSKKSSIERNLIYNSNLFEYRRKPLHRFISVQNIPLR